MANQKLSVTEYAAKMGLTPQAVRWQIANRKLPQNTSAEKIGKTYILTIRGK